MRFTTAKKTFTEKELDYFTRLNYTSHNGLGVILDKPGFQGVGTARYFVDDDDLVADAAVRIYKQYMERDIDILYCDYQRFIDGEKPSQDSTIYGSRTFSGNDICRLQNDCINRFRDNEPLISHKTLPTPWAKIYRRDFLERHGLKFIPGVTHEEDVLFNFEVLSYCRKVVKIDAVTYYYRWIITSESHRYRPKLIEDVQTTLSQYCRILCERYPDRPDLYELYRYRILWDLLYCVVLGPLHPRNIGDYRKRKKEFSNLLDSYPFFRDVIGDVSIRTTRFELKQSVLATLIRLRWFWLLNILRGVIGKAR